MWYGASSVAAVTAISWYFKGSLAEPSDIDSALLQPPLQEPLEAEPFSFVYKGKECLVEPVATYELWGLVVSHNNIHSVADIYHDSTSVDTKDLCVVWGDNLDSDDYRRVDFKSGPWTCYFRYPQGVGMALVVGFSASVSIAGPGGSGDGFT